MKQVSSGRQSKRLGQRRRGGRSSINSGEAHYADKRTSADERRQARVAIAIFGPAFVGICAAYIVMAASEVLG
jgi:hypothetical protein